MREIAVIAMMLFSLTASGCSSKTEALAEKSLMARPLQHQQTAPSADHSEDPADKPEGNRH